jgi:hypothetical protein
MNETEIKPLNPIVGATSGATSLPVKKRRSPSLKRAQTKSLKETNRGFPLPLSLTCPVTGKTNRYTSLPYIRKLIEKYGTVEALRKDYISTEARKQKQ